MKQINEIIDLLEEKIPRDVISKRDAGNGRKLDYLESWYVIDRLNQVFGNHGWDSETTELRLIDSDKPTYIAKVRITALINIKDDHYIKVIKEGTGYGRDKNALNPHEMAAKEAESDALKRAAMKFGKSMGLALYDKTQEFVDDGESKSEGKVESRESNQTSEKSPMEKPVATSEIKTTVSGIPRDVINKQISAYSKVALDKKLLTQDKLFAMLKEYSVSKKEELTDDQASALLGKLKGVVNV